MERKWQKLYTLRLTMHLNKALTLGENDSYRMKVEREVEDALQNSKAAREAFESVKALVFKLPSRSPDRFESY